MSRVASRAEGQRFVCGLQNGGAVVAASPETGVIDIDHRVFGYKNLFVCDAAAVPANVGANPSLTMATLGKRAMTKIPPTVSAPSAPAAAARTSG